MDSREVPNLPRHDDSKQNLTAPNRPMTEMPDFKLELFRDIKDGSLALTCSIVGDPAGVRAVTRKFETAEDLERQLENVGISTERYDHIIKPGDDEARSRSIQVSLNEAQRLSVVQTDSTE